MAATVNTLREWCQKGIIQEATHMVVVHDTFDNSDFPVYVSAKDNAHEVREKYDNEAKMTRVMEVYWLGGDIEAQLALRCSFTFGPE